MWRPAPRGWCELRRFASDLAFPVRSNHPAVAYGHGFPSLSKEGSSVAVMDPDNVAQPQ